MVDALRSVSTDGGDQLAVNRLCSLRGEDRSDHESSGRTSSRDQNERPPTTAGIGAEMPTFTIAELARRHGCKHVDDMWRLMNEEQARGHVQIIEDLVCATDFLEQQFGNALREIDENVLWPSQAVGPARSRSRRRA